MSRPIRVVLRSSKAVDEDPAPMAGRRGWPVPGPGSGAAVELGGGDAGGAVDLVGVDEGLAGDGLAAERPPPGLSEPMLLHLL
jgi:hypothetical protein